jgi:sec-independent protein translocase protein TatB
MNLLNNIGSPELLIILLLALLVVGPERLPEIARKVGAVVGQVRKMIENASRELDPDLGSMQRAAREVREQVDAVASIPHEMIRSLSQASGLSDVVADLSSLPQTTGLSDVAADLKALSAGAHPADPSAPVVDPSAEEAVPAAPAGAPLAGADTIVEGEKPEASNLALAAQERPPAENAAAQETQRNG